MVQPRTLVKFQEVLTVDRLSRLISKLPILATVALDEKRDRQAGATEKSTQGRFRNSGCSGDDFQQARLR